MMDLISLFLSLTCFQPKIINYTKDWNDFDQKTLEHAYTRCREIYEDAPCVKKFIKKNATTYNVVCGKVQSGDKK